MRAFLLRTRESFWFLPTVFGIVAIIVAQAFVELDRALLDRGADKVFFLDALSASGGRSILSIIGSSMLTVAGTTFSITISVLATTSSTYGPRLVRNFLADRANQVVLAVFTSTFLYALIVIRSVHTQVQDDDAFVPVIAIHVGVLLALADVAVLVFFIHHIAQSVQITTLQKRVQNELVAAVDFAYPAHEDESSPMTRRVLPPLEGAQAIAATTDGYVQEVEFGNLKDWALGHDAVVEVLAMPGTHVVDAEPVLRAAPIGDGPLELGDDDRRELRAAFAINVSRTPLGDVRFALRQMVEVAVRGLASGTNDPYTAVSALDLSAKALVPLIGRMDPPTALVDDDGRPRVIVSWPTVDRLVMDVFDGVRVYGLSHPAVIDSTLNLAERLTNAALSPERRRTVQTAVRQLLTAYEATDPHAPDLEPIRARAEALIARPLEPTPVPQPPPTGPAS